MPFKKMKICEWNNGRRFSFVTAAEKQLKQRKHCKNHCFLVVGLEKVVFREGNCQGNYEPTRLNTLLELSNAEIKNKHG